MMTDYEGGMIRLLPMKAHLTMDVLMGIGLITTATLMSSKPKVDRVALAGLGAFAIAYALMTRPEPGDRKEN